MGGDATNPYPRALEAFKSPIMGFMCPKVHTVKDLFVFPDWFKF